MSNHWFGNTMVAAGLLMSSASLYIASASTVDAFNRAAEFDVAQKCKIQIKNDQACAPAEYKALVDFENNEDRKTGGVVGILGGLYIAASARNLFKRD